MPRLWLPSLALTVFSSAGCTDLAPIPPLSCGNGVIDPGEQCDTFAKAGEGTACGTLDDGELACHYHCKGDATCPAGWGCGVDDRCRFGNGTVRQVATIPASFSEMKVGDVDGDGAADLVGRLASGTAVQAWFGDGEGAFATRFHLNTGFSAAPAAFADLDADHQTDVVVPLNEGLFVMLGKEDRTLSPVAYSALELPDQLAGNPPVPIENVYTFVVGFQPLYGAPALIFELGAPVNQLAMCFLNGCGDFGILALALLGDKRIQDFAGHLPRANIDGTPQEEFAIAFRGETSVAIFTPQPLPTASGFFDARPNLLATITLPAPIVVPFGGVPGGPNVGRGLEATALHFGDVDGDGKLDLLAAVDGGAAGVQVAVARGRGDGTFDPAAIDSTFEQLVSPDPSACELGIASPSGLMAWPLAVGDFDPSLFDHRADYVTPAGVFMARRGGLLPTVLCPASPTTSAYSEAAVGDFNHDGHLDMAAVGGELTFGQRTRAVEFQMGDGTGHFNHVVVDTVHPGTKLRVGDYDGDFVSDLALVELDWRDDASVAAESLSVLFGSVLAVPSPPVSMGRLSFIDILEPGLNPMNALTLDITSDLMAQSNSEPDGSGVRSIAVMVGTPERRMLSPFTLEGTEGPDDTFTIVSLQAGIFQEKIAADDPYADLIAVTSRNRPDSVGTSPPAVWLIQGRERAEYGVEDARILSADCPGPDAFAYGCAIYGSADLDGDGVVELLALDDPSCKQTSGDPARLLVGRVGGSSATPNLTCTTAPLPTDFGSPRGMVLSDVDGDGLPELLLGSGSDATGVNDPVGLSGPLKVTLFWNTAGALDVSAGTEVPLPDGQSFGMTAANLDEDPQRELILLLPEGIEAADVDPAGKTIAAPQVLVQIPFPFGSLATGDVNGDGLEDVVFSDTSQTRVFTTLPSGEEVRREGN